MTGARNRDFGAPRGAPVCCRDAQPKNDTPFPHSTPYCHSRRCGAGGGALCARRIVNCQASSVAPELRPMLRGFGQANLVIPSHGSRDDVGSTSAAHAAAACGSHHPGRDRAGRLRLVRDGHRSGQAGTAAAGRRGAEAATAGRRRAAAGSQADPAGRSAGQFGLAARGPTDRSRSRHRADRERGERLARRADDAPGCGIRNDLALRAAELRDRGVFLPESSAKDYAGSPL